DVKGPSTAGKADLKSVLTIPEFECKNPEIELITWSKPPPKMEPSKWLLFSDSPAPALVLDHKELIFEKSTCEKCCFNTSKIPLCSLEDFPCSPKNKDGITASKPCRT